jgi:polyhydroxyalkanoate synthesis regulator phasin
MNQMQEAFMKMSTYRTILPILVLMVMSAATSLAQSEHQHESSDKKASALPAKKGQLFLDQEMLKMEASGRKNEPHYVMAMAHLQTIGTFAKALRDQASGDGQLSADFARAAVDEINRSLDKAKEHHQEHLKTIATPIRLKLAAMVKEMDAQTAKLNDAVDALEKDVQNYTLDTKQIAADSAAILKHLDELAKMYGEN